MVLKLYYFKSASTGKKRNTGVLASSVSAAKKKVTRPSDPVLYKSRSLTATEKRQAKKGTWIRTRADGKSPAKSKVKGKGFFGSGNKRKRK